MAKDLYIGSLFEVGNIYNEDGTAMAAAPYVTLHDRERDQYFVADTVTADGDEYYAAFTKNVTKKMTEGLLDLEIYTGSNMAQMLKFCPEYAYAREVSATPGQHNAS